MLETTPAAQSSLLTRTIQREIEQESPVRAVLIFGPRRIGKTTLLRQIIGQNGCRWFNGDIEGSAADLRFQSQGDVFNVLSQAPNIVIDEAHKIADIGTIVKVLVDANETLQNPCRIYLTSSSSFYLSTLKESALGRVVSRKMWPFSLYELAQRISWGTVNTYLERFLVYGLMPMACLEPEKARSYLEDYCEGYLLRDFYEQESVKHPQIVRKILIRLAHYVGSEISYDRLAQEVGISRNTVEDYVERMQACSIIQICHSFSRNLANEMKKGKKIYFFDNGVRNALIGNFQSLAGRNDAGALWENFFFMERRKLIDTLRTGTQTYFWRTTGSNPREIDFLEVLDGKIEAFECKLSPQTKSTRHAQYFLKNYPDSTVSVVHPQDCMKLFQDVYRSKSAVDSVSELGALLRG